ncbi:MAG: antibiotic biosynthesis monooxygenase [Nitrososphaerales archaeon]
MIIRIFYSKCDVEGMEKFYIKKALPTLKKQKGCVYALAGKSVERGEVVMVTVWEDLEALKGFTGPDWSKPKVVPEEKPLLKGEPNLLHFELVGEVIKRLKR